jgi:hypothetical protein
LPGSSQLCCFVPDDTRHRIAESPCDPWIDAQPDSKRPGALSHSRRTSHLPRHWLNFAYNKYRLGECMPIELNKEQQEQLDRDTTRPPVVHDPRSATRYVLIAADQYEQMLEVVEDDAEQRVLRRTAARNLVRRIAKAAGETHWASPSQQRPRNHRRFRLLNALLLRCRADGCTGKNQGEMRSYRD